jgi:hypothetical protein
MAHSHLNFTSTGDVDVALQNVCGLLSHLLERPFPHAFSLCLFVEAESRFALCWSCSFQGVNLGKWEEDSDTTEMADRRIYQLEQEELK